MNGMSLIKQNTKKKFKKTKSKPIYFLIIKIISKIVLLLLIINKNFNNLINLSFNFIHN